MNRMVSVRTEVLTGPALDWAINAIDCDQQPGTGQLQLFALPDAEQLITKYGVWVDVGHRQPWLADVTTIRSTASPAKPELLQCSAQWYSPSAGPRSKSPPN